MARLTCPEISDMCLTRWESALGFNVEVFLARAFNGQPHRPRKNEKHLSRVIGNVAQSPGLGQGPINKVRPPRCALPDISEAVYS